MAKKRTKQPPTEAKTKEMKKFFVCKSCGRDQNLDQTVHIKEKYCVSCFNKEQIHQEMIKQLHDYTIYLKDTKKDSKSRRKKMEELIQFNEMLLPKTFMKMPDDEVESALNELQQIAFKIGIEAIKEKYKFDVMNTTEINSELITKLRPLFDYKSPPQKMLEELLPLLDPIADIKSVGVENYRTFFKDLRKAAVVPYFTLNKGIYTTKTDSPFKFKAKNLLPAVKTYRKRIRIASSQSAQFKRFLTIVGQKSEGFQTLEDRLEKAIGEFIRGETGQDLEEFQDRMLSEINASEDAPLIPNIAKYILENYERLMYTWFTRFLAFDKSRFMVSDVKTGSRTDFVMRLQYRYTKSELRQIAEELKNTTELLVRSKAKQRAKKIDDNKELTPEQRKERLAKSEEQLQKDLQPQNLAQKQSEQEKSAKMTARVLILNSEKAFNIILNKIIRYHYKRLQLTTPVQYITNVLASDSAEKRGELEAWYLIHSREW